MLCTSKYMGWLSCVLYADGWLHSATKQKHSKQKRKAFCVHIPHSTKYRTVTQPSTVTPALSVTGPNKNPEMKFGRTYVCK